MQTEEEVQRMQAQAELHNAIIRMAEAIFSQSGGKNSPQWCFAKAEEFYKFTMGYQLPALKPKSDIVTPQNGIVVPK